MSQNSFLVDMTIFRSDDAHFVIPCGWYRAVEARYLLREIKYWQKQWPPECYKSEQTHFHPKTNIKNIVLCKKYITNRQNSWKCCVNKKENNRFVAELSWVATRKRFLVKMDFSRAKSKTAFQPKIRRRFFGTLTKRRQRSAFQEFTTAILCHATKLERTILCQGLTIKKCIFIDPYNNKQI